MFVAINLPEPVKSALARYIDQLRSQSPSVKASWDRPEKAHITLKFLGGIEKELVSRLSTAAEQATNSHTPFTLAVEGTGVFPAHGHPRVLWLGIIDRSGSLERLHDRLDEECAAMGFPRDDRAFHPHLTIARIRVPPQARKLAWEHQENSFPTHPFKVSSIAVVRSELGPGGSRYTTISEHSLTSK
jgi:RNA 2',3'-cyclic 3'-phosphodiesterase